MIDRLDVINKLDCLLINFSYTHGSKHMPAFVPPLGLVSIATVLDGAGVRVGIIDTVYPQLERIIDFIKRTEVKVVGFNCNFENRFRIGHFVQLCRSEVKGLVFLAGGPQSSASPEKTLRQTGCDILFMGEAEEHIVPLVRSILEGRIDHLDLEGVCYFAGERFIQNGGAVIIRDLESLPPLRHDLVVFSESYPHFQYIVTGRGCPYSCAFCFESLGGDSYRVQSIKKVTGEIEALLETRKLHYLGIVDDTFVAYPKRVHEFCEALEGLRAKHDFVWFCEGRANIFSKHKDLLPRMVDAGLIRVQIGAESGNDHILNLYNKQITTDQIRDVVKQAVDCDLLSLFMNFIIGGAAETPDTIEQTIKFACELIEAGPGRVDISCNFLTPYPQTQVCQHPEKFGIKLLDSEVVTGFNDEYPVVETESMDKEAIFEAHKRFREAIVTCMIQELRNVPFELLKRHCQATRYEVRTGWYEILSEVPHISNYFNLYLNQSVERLAELTDTAKALDLMPLRTVTRIPSLKDGYIELNLGDRPILLNRLGTILFELASGKMNIRSIAGEAKRRLGESTPPEDVFFEHVIDFYRSLEDGYHIICSQI